MFPEIPLPYSEAGFLIWSVPIWLIPTATNASPFCLVVRRDCIMKEDKWWISEMICWMKRGLAYDRLAS